ncbi:MAG: methyltransferase domain-containing protein [Acidobacteriota bacterium]
MIAEVFTTEKRVLDVGCGRNKVAGAMGLDRCAVDGVDVVHDLEVFPYPFKADYFDEIYARHIIEHVESVAHFMDELHRIAKPGARVYINTPHYSYSNSWRDPTHRWHFSAYSFEYFELGHAADYYASRTKYRVVSVHVTMLNMWRLLGIEWMINAVNIHPRWRFLRKFWEEYLAFIFRAREIQAILEVIK